MPTPKIILVSFLTGFLSPTPIPKRILWKDSKILLKNFINILKVWCKSSCMGGIQAAHPDWSQVELSQLGGRGKKSLAGWIQLKPASWLAAVHIIATGHPGCSGRYDSLAFIYID